MMSASEEIPYESLFHDEDRSDAGSESASDISDPGAPVTFPAPNQDLRQPPDVNPARRSTASKKQNLTPQMTYNAVKETVKTMNENRIDLPIFLEAVSWGNEACIRDEEVKFQRTSLLHSRELPEILRKWHKPPRTSEGMTRPTGAKATTEAFAIETTIEIITTELKVLGPLLRLPAGKDVKVEEVTRLKAADLTRLIQSNAPVLWRVLNECLTTNTATQKDREKVSFNLYMPADTNDLPHRSY